MTLRRRLALTLLLAAVPLVAGMLMLRSHLERSAQVNGMRHFVLTEMQAGAREVCETFPAEFPRGPLSRRLREMQGGEERPPPRGGPDRPRRERGPRRRPREPVRYWAYDSEFRSLNPRSPSYPDELRSKLEAGAKFASMIVEAERGRRRLLVAMRMEWSEGPCSITLVERDLPRESEGESALIWGLAAVVALLLLAVILSAGPIVRRIRLLQRDVRSAAGRHYAEEIEVRGSDELADLARAFNEAGREVRGHLTELERREQTLRDFVANTTHDVMIPLTVLQGHLVSIRDRIEKGEPADPEEVRRSLEETHYLASLVHNLTAAAKLDAAGTELQRGPVDLGGLVERIAARHQPIAKMRGIELEHATPEIAPRTGGDLTLIEQAVSNLVHNAVRYNRAGGHVSVLLQREGERFSLRVLDDGPGVSDEQLARITERNFRGDSARRREPGGLGIGLHIARDVAERHGFELVFRRPEGGGFEAVLGGPCLTL